MTAQGDLLGDDDRLALLRVARDSIRHGLDHRTPLPVDPLDYAEALRLIRATFVTLRLGTELRGCIGVLEAKRSLVEDVAENAFAAAFRDTRFSPVTRHELSALNIHISILSPPVLMEVKDEADLLCQMRPGVDGIILMEPPRRATFLPAVWEMVREPAEFLAHLKAKGGWPVNHWSDRMQVWRYTTQDVE